MYNTLELPTQLLKNPYILYTVTFIVLIISRYTIKMLWSSRQNHFPVSGLTAIVTGGSQGLGLSLAQELAARGANVVIVAQDKKKLATAHKEVEGCAVRPAAEGAGEQQRFLNLSFDLRSPDSAPEILRQVVRWNGGRAPDLVFSCAGNCHPSFFADASTDTLRGQMDTIYWSAAYLAHATLNLWKTPGESGDNKSAKPMPSRHLVFACSTLAFVPVAGYSPYSPAKAAMRAMVDGLNQEVAVYNGSRQGNGPAPDADINVHILFPMGILTPGFDNENKLKPELTLKLEEDDKPQDPAEVAKITLKRLEAGDYMITTAFLGHVMRGAGMGGSVRGGLLDIFWNWLGSLIVIFAVPDLISKCKTWGKRHGMNSTTAPK